MSSIFYQDTLWAELIEGVKTIAKNEIVSRFNHVSATTKSDGTLLTEADSQTQLAMQTFLLKHWPQFAFLGEESLPEDQQAALNNTDGCWVLDPVDGTSNFANGIPFFSISLALIIKGEVKLGIVYDPMRDELFAARSELGATLNNHPLIAKTNHTDLADCIAIVDFKRLPLDLSDHFRLRPPYASQRSFGSVALDWCWIAAGRGELYCHGAQHLWDYAAGWLILNEAGGMSKSFDGDPVLFTQQIGKRSAIAATTPSLFKLWDDYIDQCFSDNVDDDN